MNWGYKITIVIAGFIVIMSGMVYVAMQQTNEMMDKNYYDKEMHYQELINAAENLNQINSDPIIGKTEDGLSLQIPLSMVDGFEKGTLELINNADHEHDLHIKITPDSIGQFSIPGVAVAHGSYRARISWTHRDTPYYREQDLMIP